MIVDDRKDSRRSRVKQAESVGFKVLPVETAEDALGQLEVSPEVDHVVTDIRLSTEVADDQSGIELARQITRLHQDLPVSYYSSYYAENDISDEDQQLFVNGWIKGETTWREMDALFEEIYANAVQRKAGRVAKADMARAKLKERHELEIIDTPEVLRSLVPDSKGGRQVEEALAEAGYGLALVRSSAFSPEAMPLMVWVNAHGEHAEVEVFGHPSLFAPGETTREAIEALVELMRLFHEDLQGQGGDVDGPARTLQEFLARTMN
jgi:CheY-like chemotaxis protein